MEYQCKDDAELRRTAVAVTVQLPADKKQAGLVLDYARELVERFIYPAPPSEEGGGSTLAMFKDKPRRSPV